MISSECVEISRSFDPKVSNLIPDTWYLSLIDTIEQPVEQAKQENQDRSGEQRADARDGQCADQQDASEPSDDEPQPLAGVHSGGVFVAPNPDEDQADDDDNESSNVEDGHEVAFRLNRIAPQSPFRSGTLEIRK